MLEILNDVRVFQYFSISSKFTLFEIYIPDVKCDVMYKGSIDYVNKIPL